MGAKRIRARAARAAHNDPRGRYAPPPPGEEASEGPMNIDETESFDGATAHMDPMSWRINKRDKRTIKHNALLARVAEGGIQKKPLKRRRPGKKMKTELSGLADALPDVGGESDNLDEEWEGISDEEEAAGGDVRMSQPNSRVRRRRKVKPDAQGKMFLTSLKHRPGAMRKKMIMEGKEMERFRKNLAQMVGSTSNEGSSANIQSDPSQGADTARQADRWAALRNFIGNTMQKDKAFAGA